MATPDYALLREIALAAERQNIELALLAGIVATESDFDAGALGDWAPLAKVPTRYHPALIRWQRMAADGSAVEVPQSFGLGQLLVVGGAGEEFAHDPGLLLEPVTNLVVASEYLHSCLDAFPGDMDRGVAAYNAGVGQIQRDGIINPSYVAKVRAAADHWRGEMWRVQALMHLDACYGHLSDIRIAGAGATAELLLLKKVLALE